MVGWVRYLISNRGREGGTWRSCFRYWQRAGKGKEGCEGRGWHVGGLAVFSLAYYLLGGFVFVYNSLSLLDKKEKIRHLTPNTGKFGFI